MLLFWCIVASPGRPAIRLAACHTAQSLIATPHGRSRR